MDTGKPPASTFVRKSKAGRKVEAESGGDFLANARELRHLLETDRAAFHERAKELSFNQRKAYYLVQIDRAFADIDADEALLRKVGWTKLGILAPHVSRGNYKDLLAKALGLSAQELQVTVAAEPGQPKNHHVALRMTDDQKAVFDAAIKAYSPPGRRAALVDKAAILTAALEAALSAKESP